MRFLGSGSLQHLRTRRADRFVLAQLMLALVMILLLAGLGWFGQGGFLDQIVVLCGRSASDFISRSWALVSWVPLLIGGPVLGLAVLSVGRQMWATRRLLQTLGPNCLLPPELARLGRDLGLLERLRLLADPRPVAFSAGLASPKIWLTTGLLTRLDQDALAAVIRHEAHHVRHRDPLKVLLVRSMADALFFLPVARELVHAYEVHKELEADAEAAISAADQRGLARALFHLLTLDTVDVNQAAIGPLLSGGQRGATAARLDRLTGSPVPSLMPQRRSVVITILAVLTILTIGLAPLAQPVRAEWGGSCRESEPAPIVLWLDS
jgi:Zn-dependent protease with chaperone function